MIWTHKYDLLAKLCSLCLSVVAVGLSINFLQSRGFETSGTLYAAVLIASGFAMFFALYQIVFRTFGSLLYARLSLQLKINYTQARLFNDAFAPLFALNLKWLPMRELVELDDTSKHDVAMGMLQDWRHSRHEQRAADIARFRNLSVANRLNKIVFYVLLAYCLVAGILNLPPANYVAAAVTELIDDNHGRYYPMLNAFILVLPVGLIYVLIERLIRKSEGL